MKSVISYVLEVIISFLTRLLPDKREVRKAEWLAVLAEIPSIHQKIWFILGLFCIALDLIIYRFYQFHIQKFHKAPERLMLSIYRMISHILEGTISIMSKLLPEHQKFHKHVWLGEFDSLLSSLQKIRFTLSCFQTVLNLQKKRLKLPRLSINQQIALIRLLFTSSLFIIFQITSLFSSWFITHNPIVAIFIVFISLKVLSNIYQSTKTSSLLSKINLWSFFQIGILSSCCVLAFKFHNAEGQLLLLTLLTLHLLFFQPLTKEIITLLQEWREQSDNDLSKR